MPPDPRFVVHVTSEMLRHSRINEALFFGAQVYDVVALLLILITGFSARLRDAALRMARRRFVAAMLYIALLITALSLVEFPLLVYGDFVVPHEFALTDQSFAAWLFDALKSFGVALAIVCPLGALAWRALTKYKRWWLALWVASVPLSLVMVFIAPVLIDPIYNDFKPLKDHVLERDLLAQAQRAGIERSRVFEVDKSKQTHTMNAYVTGVGASKRIVLWDTILAKLDHDELLAVMGHEMGHYVLNHLWKGLAFSAAATLFAFALAQALYERTVVRWGARDDLAMIPWMLVIAAAILFFSTPVSSAFSRHIEHEADRFGLELTHLNEPMATSFVKFAEDSKVNPDPPAFIEWWHYSHPSTRKRIEFSLESSLSRAPARDQRSR